jgi:hypothetical protein
MRQLWRGERHHVDQLCQQRRWRRRHPELVHFEPNKLIVHRRVVAADRLPGLCQWRDGGTEQNPGPGPAITQTVPLANIPAHTVYQVAWNGTFAAGNLFAFDYDDTLGNIAGTGTGDSLGNHCGSGSGTVTNLCAFVGNFDTKFSATYNGGPIAADFSPENTQGGGKIAGTFVPWEGLDAVGLSEAFADARTLTFPGTLAVITTGTGGHQPPYPSREAWRCLAPVSE